MEYSNLERSLPFKEPDHSVESMSDENLFLVNQLSDTKPYTSKSYYINKKTKFNSAFNIVAPTDFHGHAYKNDSYTDKINNINLLAKLCNICSTLTIQLIKTG
jgi:hypothetical protein